MIAAGHRALALAAAGVVLSGCSTYSLTDRIENAQSRVAVSAPQQDAARLRAKRVRPSMRQARRAYEPASAASPRADRSQAAVVLYPQTPYVGSPEFERERVQTERRERDLDRRIRAICGGC